MEGFESFGYPEEGRMVEQMLKGLGRYNQAIGKYTFAPKDIADYLSTLEEE